MFVFVMIMGAFNWRGLMRLGNPSPSPVTKGVVIGLTTVPRVVKAYAVPVSGANVRPPTPIEVAAFVPQQAPIRGPTVTP